MRKFLGVRRLKLYRFLNFKLYFEFVMLVFRYLCSLIKLDISEFGLCKCDVYKKNIEVEMKSMK